MIQELFGFGRHSGNFASGKSPVIESLPFGMILAVAGGFLDSYTYIGRGGVFCNAQTGNLVLLGIRLAKGELYASVAYLLPVIAFVVGVIVAEAIKAHGGRIFRAKWPYVALAFEIAVLFAIGLIPGKGADMPVTLTASFAASLQVSSFNRLANSSFSTTMCTGNLRLAVQTAQAGLAKKNKDDLLMSARYWLIILAFVVGAGIGAFVTASIGARAIWFAAGSLAIAMGLLLFER